MPAEDSSSPDAISETNSVSVPQNRRTAIQILTGFLGLLLNAVPATLGGLFFLNPLLRSRQAGRGSGASEMEDFIRLKIGAEAVPDDGTPVAVTVVSDLTDAWNKYSDVPIGSIWLRCDPDGKISAFNATCPHLGCAVDYRASNNDFYCPCHTSAFDLQGERTNEVPPRGMDRLEIFRATNGQRDEGGSELWVRYKDYLGGKADRIEV